MKLSKRAMLKSSAVGIVPTNASIISTPAPNYIGFTYDPRTHDIIGEATADFQFKGQEITGELNAYEEKIPISKKTGLRRVRDGIPIEEGFQSHRIAGKKLVDETEQIRSLKITSNPDDHQLTGYLNSKDDGRIAFLLWDNKRSNLRSDAVIDVIGSGGGRSL